MRTRKLPLTIPALLFSLLLILGTGCQQNGDGGNNPTIDEGGTPERGDWVVIQIHNDADALNPYLYRQSQSGYIMQNLYQTLLAIDPETQGYQPVLAKDRAIVSEDGKQFTFEIREEATWPDGSPITGKDYEFSCKVIQNPLVNAPPYRIYYSFIKDVQVDEENPRKFTVTTEDKFFLSEFSIGDLFIVPAYHYDPDGLLSDYTVPQLLEMDSESAKAEENLVAFADQYNSEKYSREPGFVVGSGPYELVEWVTGSTIKLKRKDNFWGDKIESDQNNFKGYPDMIVYRTIKDPDAAIVALKAEEIDVMSSIPSASFVDLEDNKEAKENFNLSTPDAFIFSYIGLNCMPPPGREPYFEDKRVRRAMAHCVDVESIIEKVYYGYARRMVTPIHPTRPEFNDKLAPIQLDLEKAAQLMDEAGWVDSDNDGIRDKMIDGKKVDFEPEFMIVPNRSTAKQMAQMIQRNGEKIGIRFTLREVDISIMSPRLTSHDFDMFALGYAGAPLPPDLKQVWSTEAWETNGSNFFGPMPQEADQLVDDIRQELDPAKRKPMYDRFQEIIYDHQPIIFMLHPKEKIAIHNRFRNAETNVLKPGYEPFGFWTPKALVKYK